MIGLEFICKAYGKQYKDVAEKVGIKPPTFHAWIAGKRKIPKERLEQLSEMFDGIENKEKCIKELINLMGLKYIRKIYGMSQQELAEKMKINKQSISQMERKDIKISEKSLNKMCDIFNNIPKEYFNKILTREEEFMIKLNKLKHDYKDIAEEYLLNTK